MGKNKAKTKRKNPAAISSNAQTAKIDKKGHTIQLTNDASIGSKKSAATLNYFQDPFLKYIWPKKVRRSPLINKGYWLRYEAVKFALENWFLNFSQTPKVNIISLGAGFDTLIFNINRILNKTDINSNLTQEDVTLQTLYQKIDKFIEFDYEDVVNRKKSGLADQISDLSNLSKNSNINYHLLGADLENLDKFENILDEIENLNLDHHTFVLAEVSTTYMTIPCVNNLLKFLNKKFKNLTFFSYEQIHPSDMFGQFMLKHFQKIDAELKAINTYPTLTEIQHRLESESNFASTHLFQLSEFYNHLNSNLQNELKLENINRIETFDEELELYIKMSHYCLIFAHNFEISVESRQFLDGLKQDQQLMAATSIAKNSSNLPEMVSILNEGEDKHKLMRYGFHTKQNGAILEIIGGFAQFTDSDGNLTHSRKNVPTLKISLENLSQIERLETSDSARDTCDSLFGHSQFPGRTSPADSNAIWKRNVCEFSNNLLDYSENCKKFLSIGGRFYQDKDHPNAVSDQVFVSENGQISPVSVSEADRKKLEIYNGSLFQVSTHRFVLAGGMNSRHQLNPHWFLLKLDHKNDAYHLQIETVLLKNFPILGSQIFKSSSQFEVREEKDSTAHNTSFEMVGGLDQVNTSEFVLVDGVDFKGNEIGLLTFSITSKNCKNFEITFEKRYQLNNFMLLNGQAVKYRRKLFLLGGGCNCFSFGTYLNSGGVMINLDSL